MKKPAGSFPKKNIRRPQMTQKKHKQKVVPFFSIQCEDLSQQSEMTPTEELCIEKEKLMLAILDNVNDGVFTIDFNMRITSFNRAAERITGYSTKEAIGRLCMDVFCDSRGFKKDCMAECPMKKTMQSGQPITKKQMIINKRGEVLTVSSTTNLLYDLNNKPIGGLSTFVDVTAFEKLKEKWQGKKYNFGDIIGKSPRMIEVYRLIESISGSLANVLIQGETGTGKDLIASAIHYHSIRHRGPFVHVNCTALPETLLESELFGHVKGAFTGAIADRKGRFEVSQKGTLFLDEIGDLSPAMQAKLLKVVEEKRFERVGGSNTIKADVRIISATNKDLKKAISEKTFREDLYYRLNVIPVNLPPLRERMEDLPLLVEHFIEKQNYKKSITVPYKWKERLIQVSPEIYEIFSKYNWPGNVRELENVLEYAFIRCNEDCLDVWHLPPEFNKTDKKPADTFMVGPISSKPNEKERLLKALQDCRWKRDNTAKHLNISRPTLWRMMKKHGVSGNL